MRNARLCRLLAEQGTDVVCATISLFHDVQRWNRENIPGYREIYLRVPIDELRRRDSKGIYARSQRGDARDVVGIDVPAEAPEAPDLMLDNYGELDVATAVDRILAVCDRRDGAGAAPPERLVAFKTKAETLEALAPMLRNGRVLPQVRFSVGDWRSDAAGVLAAITAAPWGSGRVIVRSSARGEDGAMSSQAGKYDSVLGVTGSAAVAQAIDQVIESFAEDGSDDDQIFVQPMLDRVAMAGVVFSRSPSGGPYFIINYDDRSGLTDRVTGGTGDNLKTFYCLKSRPDACPPSLAPVIALVSELETLLACDAIDVEFAVGDDGQLYLLQVRPLAVDRQGRAADAEGRRPRSPMSRARSSCSAARIPTCTAAGRYSASCRTGTRPKSSGCGPGRSRCRSIANSSPTPSGPISGTITDTRIFAVFRCWSAFTDCPTSTCGSASTPSYHATYPTISPGVS